MQEATPLQCACGVGGGCSPVGAGGGTQAEPVPEHSGEGETCSL